MTGNTQHGLSAGGGGGAERVSRERVCVVVSLYLTRERLYAPHFCPSSFGPGFTYYRDPTPDMPWPTGIVYRSKYKLLDAGHWPSPALKQRGATFVRLDLHNGTADITDAEFDAVSCWLVVACWVHDAALLTTHSH